MKKIFLGAVALFSFSAMSQLSMEILPYTNQNLVITNPIQSKTVAALDIEEEVRMALEEGDRNRAGKILDVNYSLENSGTWTDLDNGDRIWQLRIEAPNAMGVNLYFNEYELPENATLHIFNSDRSKFMGAFTSKNNKYYMIN